MHRPPPVFHLQSSMDRLKDVVLKIKSMYGSDLQSSMDRLKAARPGKPTRASRNLQSSMDRLKGFKRYCYGS